MYRPSQRPQKCVTLHVNIKEEEELKYNEHTMKIAQHTMKIHKTPIFPGKKTGGNISWLHHLLRSFCQEMIDDGANLG